MFLHRGYNILPDENWNLSKSSAWMLLGQIAYLCRKPLSKLVSCPRKMGTLFVDHVAEDAGDGAAKGVAEVGSMVEGVGEVVLHVTQPAFVEQPPLKP